MTNKTPQVGIKTILVNADPGVKAIHTSLTINVSSGDLVKHRYHSDSYKNLSWLEYLWDQQIIITCIVSLNVWCINGYMKLDVLDFITLYVSDTLWERR